MSEPIAVPKQPDLKMIMLVIWIAIITAVIVTLIDWKIKSDILRLTDAFYRTYPGVEDGNTRQAEPLPDLPADSVLPVSRVDNDSGMEAADVLSPDEKEVPTPTNWDEFAAQFESGAAKDSE